VGSDHRGTPELTAVVRVVPDVPSFAVDDGFAYSVPDGLSVGVGDIVRIPLGGRRVRGWVVGATEPPDARRIRPLIGRSGEVAVFDASLLDTLRWAAQHYVAPLAAVLAKATPPNLPKGLPRATSDAAHPSDAAGSVSVHATPAPWASLVGETATPLVSDGESVIVVAPTWPEAEALIDDLGDRGLPVVVGSSHLSAALLTRNWMEAATVPGRLIIGTRDVAWWLPPSLGAAIVLDDGRRGLKEKAMPTVHARDLLLRRSRTEGFAAVIAGAVPTPEALAAASRVVRSGRAWGLVEVVDRGAAEAGDGTFARATAAAIRAAVADGRRVFVLTHRRGGAQRCARCRLLRRCGQCGAAPGTGTTCERCGAINGACAGCGGERFEALSGGIPRLVAEAGRLVGEQQVGDSSDDRGVTVGTERDLVGLTVDLAVVPDADGFVMAPNYRAAEDGLRTIARAVLSAGPGGGRRAVVQTLQPDHPVMTALRRGDAIEFLGDEGRRRAALGFPPGGEVMVVEASGLPGERRNQLAEVIEGRAVVHGPTVVEDTARWYVQGPDLRAAKVVVRPLVGEWREAGVRIRVDADPIDL
jgi:primosomal protein N' (replication factor Y)